VTHGRQVDYERGAQCDTSLSSNEGVRDARLRVTLDEPTEAVSNGDCYRDERYGQ
jgi:hypothetical protein